MSNDLKVQMTSSNITLYHAWQMVLSGRKERDVRKGCLLGSGTCWRGSG